MEIKQIALVLAYTSTVLASPLESSDADPPNDFVELFREPARVSNGTLIYYGPTKTVRAEASSIEERGTCFTSVTPTCDTKNSARNDICDALVTELNGDAPIGPPPSSQQICYLGFSEENAYCCVSWHNKIAGLIKGDLAGYAQKILQTCTTNGISGRFDNTRLYSTCTRVCMSNRGTNC